MDFENKKWLVPSYISEEPFIRNWKRSEILPYLQADKLICDSFIDAGRGQEIPGSETKDIITHSTASSMNIMFVSILLTPSVPLGDTEDPQWMFSCSGCESQLKNPKLREPESFIMGSQHAYPLPH